MSINAEFRQYQASGGTLTETAYAQHLDALRTQVGNSITSNYRSVFGKRIFEYLEGDVASAIAFVQVSRNVYERSKGGWFAANAKGIVLKYIQQGVTYQNFLTSGGWQEIAATTAKVVGVGLTLAFSIKAGIHAGRVPTDAPRRQTTIRGSHGQEFEVDIVDHPDAVEAANWTLAAVGTGSVTTVAIAHGIVKMVGKITLVQFFSVFERELIDDAARVNIGQKIVTPGFREWKLAQMRKNLVSNPTGWQTHPELSRFICPLSGEFMLFPVKDSCGHYFDYRSLRAHQLDPATTNPLECPISRIRPNNGLFHIRFDKARFDHIQRVIRGVPGGGAAVTTSSTC